MARTTVVIHDNERSSGRRYGFWAFILDLMMIALTSGVWIIWIFIRQLRRR